MEILKDIEKNVWVFPSGHIRKYGRTSYVVHHILGSGQFNSKKKAFAAAVAASGDEGVSPNDHADNLARLRTNDEQD